MTADALPHNRPLVPYGALAVGAFGALVGGTFPISVIFSLGDIGGGFSVSADDAAWISTLYNVGQLIGQPLLMIVVAAEGRGRAMQFAGLGFCLTSLAVAFSTSLPLALGARLAQGVFGGMLPTLMMLLAMTAPLQGRARIAALSTFAVTASLGVGLGAGGAAVLLDLGGWRSLFWAQAACGGIYLASACFLFRGDAGDPARWRETDWGGFLLLSLGLGLLAIGLGEGERRFWFETWWVTASLACGGLATGLALVGLHAARHPLLRLDVLRLPTLRWSLVLQLLFRFGLITIIAVIPQYLMRTQGLRIEQVGPALVTLALATLVAAPVAWWTSCRLDPRATVSGGLVCFAVAAAAGIRMGPDWSVQQFAWPILLFGCGQALFGIAILRFATWEVAPAQGPTVGVLFNVARVFGLVGGLSVATHVLVEREKFHSARLVEALGALNPLVTARIATQSAAAADAAGGTTGLSLLGRAASRQAFVQGYADVLLVIAFIMIAAAILVWALPALPPVATPARTQRIAA